MIGPFKKQRRPKPPDPFVSKPIKSAAERKPVLGCAPSRADGTFRRAIETGRGRLFITGAVMAFAFAAVGARVVDLGALTPADLLVAPTHAAQATALETERATIVDRNGVILATSMRTTALAARPARMLDPVEAAYKLATVFPEIDPEQLIGRLTSGKTFVYIHRRVTPRMEQAVMELGIPGLHFEEAESRVYPQGNLVSHILGFTDVDGNGLAGIERGLNARLTTDAEPVRLSIDLRMQHAVYDALGSAITQYDAIGGSAVVLDVKTGEILSMVSMPDFDPNAPREARKEELFNRTTLGVYELGSTFKIFNTAMGLENNVVTLEDGYDASEPLRVSRFMIRDFHAKNRYLTIPEIFVYSSNIGSAQLALDIGPPAQKEFFQRLGFLDPLSLEIPETAHPLYPARWTPISAMTIAYGHGISVTPLHLATGIASVVNGGTKVSPTLLARDEAETDLRIPVLRAETSYQMNRLIRLNATDGSGGRALVPGYMVGGKTGTAEKPNGTGYHRKSLISSFVAAFPMNDPKYVVYVVLDEPEGTEETFGYATGGWVAAPAAGEIIKQIAAIQGLSPIDEDAPEIRQAFDMILPEEPKKLVSLQQ